MAGGSHEQWSSRTGFILAAIGGAVGLGNIWKFPYETGENGGGAFVITYLIAALAIALPILIGELYIGKRGQAGPVSGTTKVAAEEGASKNWSLIGWLGMLAAFFVLTFYSVIAGQALDYFFITISGTFNGMDAASASAEFDNLQNSVVEMGLWHTVFMGVTAFIVSRGVTGGIEAAVKVMMPAFFIMLIGMLIYSMVAADFAAGWNYLFTPDWEKGFSPATMLSAVGQAFFSIGISFGYMLAYGAYLPKEISIPKTSVIITLADTAVAIVAGLIIFPIVFMNGLEPAEGPDLIFRALPTAFAQMTGGQFVGGAFFLLLTFAALSSSIAILQPAVSYLEESHGMSASKAAIVASVAAWVIGFGSVFAYNIWSDITIIGDRNFMDSIGYVTDNIMMPLGGILIALFAGWKFKIKDLKEEFGEAADSIYFTAWLWLSRVVAPAAVTYIMISGLFF